MAQGYWVPYACARAVCLTFCYSIRWALTPVFGPSFVNECLTPDDPGFLRFRIAPSLVLTAAQEARDWKTGSESRGVTPADNTMDQAIPRSMPANMVAGKSLRPRKEKQPSFQTSSPFQSDSDASSRHYSHKAPTITKSPDLSPKSNHLTLSGAGWTSINSNHGSSSPPHRVDSLASALLTEPRFSPTISWRGAEPPLKIETDGSADPLHTQRDRNNSHASVQPAECGSEYGAQASRSSSGSESDDVEISISPPTKRKSSTRSAGGKAVSKRSTKFNATEAHAAHWLLNLSARDAELASESNSAGGLKRKAGLM